MKFPHTDIIENQIDLEKLSEFEREIILGKPLADMMKDPDYGKVSCSVEVVAIDKVEKTITLKSIPTSEAETLSRETGGHTAAAKPEARELGSIKKPKRKRGFHRALKAGKSWALEKNMLLKLMQAMSEQIYGIEKK